MRFSIGLTRLPLPQFTWGSIDRQVEKPLPAPAETVTETTVKEGDNE
jgi:hypothetical protein